VHADGHLIFGVRKYIAGFRFQIQLSVCVFVCLHFLGENYSYGAWRLEWLPPFTSV
jgi:hypothetical protein